MSTKIQNVVYRAPWSDEISANFESVSFSTATPVNNNHRAPALRAMQRKAAHTSGRLECSDQDWRSYFKSFNGDLLVGSTQFVIPPVRSTKRVIGNCGSQSTSRPLRL